MKKVGIISINADLGYMPLAAAYLNASLIESGLPEPVILTYSAETPPDHILIDIVEKKLDIAAFSCYVWNINIVKAVARRLKIVCPGCEIVLGGPEVSPVARTFMEENTFADVVVSGEGEFVFPELIRRLSDERKDMRGVPGTTFRSGEYVVSGAAPEDAGSLDDVPDPFRFGPFKNYDCRSLPIETMRGCRHGCRFCYYKKGSVKLRYFSEERVKRWIDHGLRESRAREIYLMDPTFGSDRRRSASLCRYITENNESGKEFHTEIRAEEVDAEFAALMSGANIKTVEVGLQSTDPEVLKKCGRPVDMARLREGLSCLRKAGVKTELQLIAGMPGDSESSFLRSLNEAVSLDPDTLFCFRLLVLPGTYFHDHAEELGIVHEGCPPWRVMSTREIDFSGMTRIMRCSKYASLLFSRCRLTTKYILAEIKRDIASVAYEWAGEPDGKILDEPTGPGTQEIVLSELIPSKLEKLCRDNNADFNFYRSIMIKEYGTKTE